MDFINIKQKELAKPISAGEFHLVAVSSSVTHLKGDISRSACSCERENFASHFA